VTAAVTGVVVAGGRSTRFGDDDKALAEIGDQPMLRCVVATLGTVTDEVVVNCRPDQRAAFQQALAGVDTEVRYALDEEPDEGPLAGLTTALTAVDTEFAIVLGCDMPLADGDALAALLERAQTTDADAVVPTTEGGPEPLHAVYRVESTRTAAQEALGDGRRSLHALLDGLRVETVPVGEGAVPAQSVTSVDTQARLREIREEIETENG
jgi:molybdopterin-guanine dinucleotide biosynthesis protein A